MDQFVHGHNSQHYENKEHNYLISQQYYNHYWHWSKEFVILALGQFHYFNLRKIAMKATLAKDGGVVRGIGGLKWILGLGCFGGVLRVLGFVRAIVIFSTRKIVLDCLIWLFCGLDADFNVNQ